MLPSYGNDGGGEQKGKAWGSEVNLSDVLPHMATWVTPLIASAHMSPCRRGLPGPPTPSITLSPYPALFLFLVLPPPDIVYIHMFSCLSGGCMITATLFYSLPGSNLSTANYYLIGPWSSYSPLSFFHRVILIIKCPYNKAAPWHSAWHIVSAQ